MSPDSESPLVEGRDLSRSYRLGEAVVPAVRGVSLAIRAGEFVALRGPSGSGKTTLLNLLGLLDRPDGGEVRVEGRDGEALSENERSDLRRDRFGFVFQTFNLIPVMSAEENVSYPLVLAGEEAASRRARARKLLEAVGMPEKAAVRPDLLSGGQRQRVAIARALANRPAIVFADEPTANLDSRTGASILQLMRHMQRRYQISFIFSSHDPMVLERADRVVKRVDGQVVHA